MNLDPTLKRLVTIAYLNGFGQIHQLTPEQIRLYLSHPKLKITPAHFKDVHTDEALQLRCYTPSHLSDKTLPAVIYLSATAFVLDRLDASNDYCSLLANNLGMKIINIAHRLAPEHKFPQFLYDCLNSIKWISHHGAMLQIDSDKLSIWGESSGASIAATCTHLLRDEAKPNLLKYQTLFYPMVDLVTPFPSKETFGYGYMLDKPFIAWLDAKGFHPEQNRACPLVSPLLASSFANLPPATIITAECDPLRDEGEAYAQKLIDNQVVVKTQRFDGMIHGFMRFYPKVKASQSALTFACNALKNALI
ncbi:MAG: alpha/beta hydrolase [Proteobacteria bacterium]|nr:alpha/beta hydrolase [Pseudomonadota bacterium]